MYIHDSMLLNYRNKILDKLKKLVASLKAKGLV